MVSGHHRPECGCRVVVAGQQARAAAMTPAGRWLAWAALTGVSFTALEADALRRRDQPSTLTHCLRAGLGLQPRRPRWLLRVAVFNAALLWIAAHITSGRLGFDIRWPAADPLVYLGD